MGGSAPPNVFVSSHPLLHTKLALLRSTGTPSIVVRSLTECEPLCLSPRAIADEMKIREISTILAYEATKEAFTIHEIGEGTSPLNASYTVTAPAERAAIVPVLRSGLQMVNAFLTLLPSDTVVHHLGLFRDKHTFAPVEYYNKLPPPGANGQVDIAFVVDPVIATGGTASTVVAILKEWGVRKIVFTSVLASSEGIERAASEWSEGTVFHVGAIDPKLNDKGYIIPGVGDIGDRLFGTQ